jgi:predicted SAM-dependent methyltransferase
VSVTISAPSETAVATGDLPKRVNLGCGFDRRDGYLNVDFQEVHEPDLLADVRSLPMLPSGYFDEVLAQDVLEHLERGDVDPALREWARLLAVGGRLVLRVPDLIGLARLLAYHDQVADHHKLIQNLYGTQAYTGDFHLSGFTELTLRASLHDAGFEVESIERFEDWLFDCVAVRSDALGVFDPGPLPFLAACDHDPGGRQRRRLSTRAGTLDRVVTAVANQVPEGPRLRARRAWRPVRRRLVERGVIQ